MRIAIRTDSSVNIGSGHLIRCLTLANELRRRGVTVIFICRELPGNLINKIVDCAHYVHRLAAPPLTTKFTTSDLNNQYAAWLAVTVEHDAQETKAILSANSCDWLIVDHYALDRAWEQLIRPYVNKILVIDDLANRHHDCDLLLDQNYFKTESLRYKEKVPPLCKCLLGPRYALLQSEYAQLRSIIPPRDGHIFRILVFFGSVDPTNQTAKVLTALTAASLAQLGIDLVIGANHHDFATIEKLAAMRPATFVHTNLPSLAGLMIRADLAIGAGGATTWERLCLGLPTIAVIIAENQQEFTAALTAENYQLSIPNGMLATTTDWQQLISGLIAQPQLIAQVAKKAKSVVDGLGTQRVAAILLGNDALRLKIRAMNRNDDELLFTWVNDPEVRKQSFQQKIISAAEHTKWFAKKLLDPNCIMLLGEDDYGLPLGQVRFEIDKTRREALISISVEPTIRGMGVAKTLLRQALDYWATSAPNIKLIAEIRNENIHSQRLFLSLNFTPGIPRRKGSQLFEL